MMNKHTYIALALMSCLLPATSFAQEQDAIQTDSTETNTKEVKNRNVMLNASSADQPRQISIGLPSSLSATIFEDGLPVSYSTWPDMPYFSWFGGTAYSKISVMSLSETALQYGAVGYTVDSYHRRSGEKFNGTINYQLNQYGRQSVSATIGGPIAKGFGYFINTHQVWDPGTAHMEAARLQNRTQVYKAGVDKHFAGGRGYMSLIYQYSRLTSNSSTYAPFIFVGDGSVKKYNGFNYGTDSYYGNEASSFYYKDVITGEVKKTTWKDAGTTDNHQLTFNLDYDFKNGAHLNVASKMKLGDVSMASNSVSGIVDNNGSYYLADGTAYKGDKVQNRWMMYVPGYERSWLTTAVLTGKSKNQRHSWRIGANFWYNRAQVQQMNTVMAHEVCSDPAQLYVKTADGQLQPYTSLNPGSGEYYDGHENKIAVFLSDDWTISRHLWMSLGARLEYLSYSGRGALNPTENDTYNTRTMGWYLNNGTSKLTRFTGDWINPAFTYNIRYTISRGFGLVGEYVYVRQRPNLQDYAGASMPTTAPVNINMGRGGIFFNAPWIQLVSQVSFISQTNYKSRTNFYHTMQSDGGGYKAGAEVSVTQPITYNIQTVGWTTDVVLTPFKGFTFHGLLTLQNPVYKKFKVFATFPDGVTDGADVTNNTVTAMSKTLIELDPSYAWKQWRIWLSFRYFSRQYINKTNSLYFNGHWESFGGLSYALNKKVNFALNVVNIFNQSGATGSISAADLVTDTSKYKNYLMSGSYIRPFEVSLSTTINL